MHATCLTFFLGKVQNSRRLVFRKYFEIVRTDLYGVLAINRQVVRPSVTAATAEASDCFISSSSASNKYVSSTSVLVLNLRHDVKRTDRSLPAASCQPYSLLLCGLCIYIDLGALPLKGISEPIRLLRVSAARAIESRFEAARSEVTLTPLVGREEELALLLRRWQQAKESDGQVVMVGAEPGIGKSRLTRVLRERLGQERHMVLRYQCSPYHLNSALYPVIEQFERAAGFAREDTPEQKLDKLQAVLAGSEQRIAESAPLFAALPGRVANEPELVARHFTQSGVHERSTDR